MDESDERVKSRCTIARVYGAQSRDVVDQWCADNNFRITQQISASIVRLARDSWPHLADESASKTPAQTADELFGRAMGIECAPKKQSARRCAICAGARMRVECAEQYLFLCPDRILASCGLSRAIVCNVATAPPILSLEGKWTFENIQRIKFEESLEGRLIFRTFIVHNLALVRATDEEYFIARTRLEDGIRLTKHATFAEILPQWFARAAEDLEIPAREVFARKPDLVRVGAIFAPPGGPNARADMFNYWRGWHNLREHQHVDVAPVLRFINDIWCARSRDRAQFVVSWFAHIIQMPGAPPERQLLFRGFAPGIVRPLLNFIAHRAIGEQYFAPYSGDECELREDCLLTIADNVRAKEIKGIMNRARGLWERARLPRVVLEPARAECALRPLVRVIALVARAKPIPVDHAQRRFGVVDCARDLDDTSAQMRALKEFMELPGAPESLFDYFAHLAPLSLFWDA